MKKLILLLIIFTTYILNSQTFFYPEQRYIEVTGSAEISVDPDEIVFVIGFSEYWEEEFEGSDDYKDFETKVPIKGIEDQIMKRLFDFGLSKEDVVVSDVGNTYRARGKDFLLKKEYELVFNDYEKIVKLINIMDVRGIDYMRIKELKNNKIEKYRMQVKVEALKAAQLKAKYLLESIGDVLGDVISIEEITNDYRSSYIFADAPVISNRMLESGNNSAADQIKQIKLRYEVKAKFEIIQ